MLEKITEIRVRYNETDRMGIVYHANYYVWFEIGRTEFMKDIGINYRSLEEGGILLPLVETHCYYKLPAKYDDVVLIKTKLSEFKGIRISFEYEIIRKCDNALLAVGKTVQAFVNSELKPVNIRNDSFPVYKILKEKCEN